VTQRHRVFSVRRIGAIAANTLTELTRLKVFYVLLLFALVLIGSSAFMAQLTFQQELQVLKDIALGAISIFTSLLAILATARLLPHDIEDRTIYTILAKPVERIEYLLGKFLGVVLLLAISTLVMSALFFLVLFSREHTVLAATARQMSGAPPDQLADALRGVRAAGFNTSLIPAIAIIYVKSVLLSALTLFISTFATTSIFTIVTTVFVYFIGHLQGTAREYWLENNGGGGIVARTFLAIVTLLFPDLQLFNLADDVAAGAHISGAVFSKVAALGGGYSLMYLLFAWAVFYRKEL
jgi:hypothetical protein